MPALVGSWRGYIVFMHARIGIDREQTLFNFPGN
jgi:hypothetical protein